MTEQIWDMKKGDGPLVATAIHDGHAVRDDVRRHMVLDEAVRRREEDPYTSAWTRVAPIRIVGLRSRFEVDLNRPREEAVYRTPADCWGLNVWSGRLPQEVVAESLAEYDAFYRMLDREYRALAARYGRIVVFDLHSYNHRREGPLAAPADETGNPQVNVGTGTMQDRARWGGVIDRFIADLIGYGFPGGRLDVRENVKFRGGQHPRWAHATFPDSCCMLSVEVKKFFVDEWTGTPDMTIVAALGDALASTVPGVLEELERS